LMQRASSSLITKKQKMLKNQTPTSGVWVPEDGDSCHKTGKIDRSKIWGSCHGLPVVCQHFSSDDADYYTAPSQ